MLGARGEDIDAGVEDRSEARVQRAQQEQVNQIAEAVVLTPGREYLGAGVQLLGDLVADRQAPHLLGPDQSEVLDADRIENLGFVAGTALGR